MSPRQMFSKISRDLTSFDDELLEGNEVDFLFVVVRGGAAEELEHAHRPESLQVEERKENIFVEPVLVLGPELQTHEEVPDVGELIV
jgi:hypothetical protein